MSKTVGSSLCHPIGPIDETDIGCHHGGLTLPVDPTPRLQHVIKCDQQAVFAVSHPASAGTYAVCGFHLGRWAIAYPDAAADLDHPLSPQIPDTVWLRLRNVPASITIAGEQFDRLGLDQRGHGHFLRGSDRKLLVVRPGDHDLVIEHAESLGDRSLAAWLTYVRNKRGWAGFDDRIAPDG